MTDSKINIKERMPDTFEMIIEMIDNDREGKIGLLEGLLAEVWHTGYTEAMIDFEYVEGEVNDN